MYFIHYIQTYASGNRKGSELQSHILKFKDCLLKDRNALDDLKEEIHCRIEELDARYPRTQPLHFDAGNDSGRWYIHVKGKPDNLVCIISIANVRNLLGKGTVSYPGKAKDGEKG